MQLVAYGAHISTLQVTSNHFIQGCLPQTHQLSVESIEQTINGYVGRSRVTSTGTAMVT